MVLPPLMPSSITTVTTQAEFDSVMAGGSQPGAIIILHGEFQLSQFLSIAGTQENPVRVFGGDATLYGQLSIDGVHTHWHDLHVIAPPEQYTVWMVREGTRLSHCDLAGGYIGVCWFGSGEGVIEDSHIHGTSGYGLYSHNHLGGLREIINCTFENIGGYYGMHFYSDANRIRDYIVAGCTVDKPVIVHSGAEVSNVNFIENNFHSALKLGNGFSVSNKRQYIVTGNTFSGTEGITVWSWSDLVMLDNVFDIEPATWALNVHVRHGENEKNTLIDNNSYAPGWFVIDNVDWINFESWQAAGYDANGVYIP